MPPQYDHLGARFDPARQVVIFREDKGIINARDVWHIRGRTCSNNDYICAGTLYGFNSKFRAKLHFYLERLQFSAEPVHDICKLPHMEFRHALVESHSTT